MNVKTKSQEWLLRNKETLVRLFANESAKENIFKIYCCFNVTQYKIKIISKYNFVVCFCQKITVN